MEDPSSPVDWDVVDAELDGKDEDWQPRLDSLADVQVLTSQKPDGDAGSLQEQRDAIEKREGYINYCSDEEQPTTRISSMAVFKDIVRDTGQDIPPNRQRKPPSEQAENSLISGTDIERFSLLRIKDRVVPSAEINRTLADLRFVRLQAIKTAMMCAKFTGSWATVGVIVEKRMPRLSTKGKNFVVWKLGTLERSPVSLLLFGGAYTEHWKEPLGTIIAIFNAGVRPDEKSKEPCLSVFSRDQLMKLGTSVDYRICLGKRKDGTPCTMVLNRQLQGQFCQYHARAAQDEFKTSRPELNGGKLTIVGPGVRRGYPPKPVGSPIKDEVFRRPLKHITTSELKDLLSNAEKMPTKSYSQGKRFLEVMAQRNSGTNQQANKGVKRQNSREANKTGKRAPLTEKQLNVNSSACKHELQTSTFKSKSKTTGVVMEIDTADEVDDSMVLPNAAISKLMQVFEDETPFSFDFVNEESDCDSPNSMASLIYCYRSDV